MTLVRRTQIALISLFTLVGATKPAFALPSRQQQAMVEAKYGFKQNIGASVNPSVWTILRESHALNDSAKYETFHAAIRWNHAKELLGKSYHKSVVKAGEDIHKMDGIIHAWIRHNLKPKWKHLSQKISLAITEESLRHGMDPVFLLAVIENESSFDLHIVGSHGEIGLMQLTPDTAKWVSDRLNLKWKGPNSLRDPVLNIKLGTAYMAYLREKFNNKGQLYLAAYNMGSGNVYRNLAKQIMPNEYSSRVMKRYLRYYTKLKEHIKIAVDSFSPAITWRHTLVDLEPRIQN